MAVDRGRFAAKRRCKLSVQGPKKADVVIPISKIHIHIGTACNFDVTREAMFIFMVEGKRTRRSNSNLQG